MFRKVERDMGIANEAAKAAIPGLGAAEAAANIAGNVWQFGLRHPGVAATLGVTSMLACLGAFPFADGLRQSFIDFESKTTVESDSNGYGTITQLSLDIQPQPLIAYTADVTGVKTRLSHDTKATILGKTVTIPSFQGDVWVTSDTAVDTTINYDASKVSVAYDPGKLNDTTDDQLIITVPLAAFSTNVSAEPTQEPPQISSDIRNLPANLVSTYAKDLTQLRAIPGVTAVEGVTDETAQTLLYTNQVKSLNNVATTCTPKLTENKTVYDGIKNNIAVEGMDALARALKATSGQRTIDPALKALGQKSFEEVSNMRVVVRIGAETKQNPEILDQKLNTTNKYTALYNEIKSNKLYQDNTDGSFTCEMSDSVKKLIAVPNSTTTPASSSSAPQAKETP